MDAKQLLWKLWRWQPLRRALALYVAMRVGLSVWAVLVLAISPSDAPGSGLEGLLLEPWRRFDTVHYIKLATYGYEPGSRRTVFPPLYPTLIRVAGGALGERHLLAALLVSNLCAVGYLVAFFMLAEEECGREVAQRAQVYAVLYPWAFFLLAGYTESLFLFLVGLSFWMMRRGWGWASGLCGALAALTRLQGAVLVLPLLFEALRARGYRVFPLGVDLVWPVLPALGSLGFLLGRAWVGIEPISTVYAVRWNQGPTWPWVGMIANLNNMIAGVAHPTDYLDFVVVLIFIVLTGVAWRRLRFSYVLYMAVMLFFSTASLRTPHPMASVGRYMMALFPAFFLLGQWGRNAWLNRLILYPSVALFLYLSGQFVLGGWVG
ncbi:MAG: hypothetical protein JXA14_06915 [Anaerolineae bacterium]|nr:hypothetical protein [Anaerolineae bacterium]